MTITHGLHIAAAVCFGIATLNLSSPVNLTALGLLCWVLTTLV